MKELTKKYSDYFTLNREAVFLQMNKTSVVPGENIWFSAYVYNPKFQEPNLSTTNLHVNLYDASGQLKVAKTVFIKNGFGTGFFDVNSLPSGKYMVKAFTKYMDNFMENLSFSQPITILGENTTSPVSIKYDLQLLPEGGHLVNNVYNTVGVKLIDNSGKGVFFTDGKVVNGKNEVVNTFKANRFGLSKFGFVPISGEKYQVVLTPENGNEISRQVPESSVYGISLTTNVLHPGEILFSFKTNRETFKKFPGKTWHMALNKDGTMEAIGFVFSEENLEANISISKKSLAPGINTVTVFNEEFQPVLERMVFNAEQLKRKSVRANFLRKNRDSLVIGLNSKDSLGLHSISISVLPSGTKAYNPKNNVFSAFYIEPYIQGELEDGSYYFSKETKQRRRNYDLDLLLLTQGWSKYSWDNVFGSTPKEIFTSEQGFSLLGGLNQIKDAGEREILLVAKDTNLFEFIGLEDDGAFKLQNLYLLDSTSIFIGLFHKRNQKLLKPSGYLSVLPKKDHAPIVLPTGFGKNIEQNTEASSLKQVKVPENFISGAVSLETVTVNAELMDEEQVEDNFRGHVYFRKFNPERFNKNMLLENFLRTQGFRVIRGRGVNGGLQITNPRANSITGSTSPLLIIDEMERIDYQSIEYMTMSDIETVYINKSGAGYGIDGAGGVIKLKLKQGSKKRYSKETMLSQVLDNGFAAEKEFYAPKYTSYSSGFFKEYGVIDWLPNFSFHEKTTFKILNTLQPEIKLYIEGMTLDGALISERIKLKIN